MVDIAFSFSGDQLVLLTVAFIYLAYFGNAYIVFHQSLFKPGETFWLWGLVFLSISYIGFGLGPVFGRPSLSIANATYIFAYVSLALQLRFWLTSDRTVLPWVFAASLAYVVVFELLRETMPYIGRATLGHVTLIGLMTYGLWVSVRLYHRDRSIHMLILSCTLALELICILGRLSLFWLTQDPFAERQSIFQETIAMIVLRWILLLANAVSYLTVMTYVLAKTLGRNDELGALLKEKQQLLDAVSKASRSRHAGTLADALTHELRQPLTNLQLTAARLPEAIENHNLQDVRMLMGFVQDECKRSSNIMAQLESLFRSQPTDKQGVSLLNLFGAIKTMLASHLSANQVELTCHGHEDCLLDGNSTKLEAVFVNIVSNAITALADQPHPRTIDLTFITKGNRCVIELRDNGPGFDPIILQNIGSAYVSDRPSGSGIGLWLSKMIIESYQGIFEVSNHSRGAMVRINLPRHTATSQGQ
jgi:signal transduction histidine kinase